VLYNILRFCAFIFIFASIGILVGIMFLFFWILFVLSHIHVFMIGVIGFSFRFFYIDRLSVFWNFVTRKNDSHGANPNEDNLFYINDQILATIIFVPGRLSPFNNRFNARIAFSSPFSCSIGGRVSAPLCTQPTNCPAKAGISGM
jgi:hypothetical protein